MPLVLTDLSDALGAVFSGFPDAEAEAAEKIAKAYGGYASGGRALATAPVAAALDAAVVALTAAIANAFTAGRPDAGAAAAVLDTAFVAFWTVPPMAFQPPPPSPPTMTGVVALAPPNVLSGALAGVLKAGVTARATARAQARDIATVLDGWTRTVTVTCTPTSPPGPPVVVPLV